METLSERLLLEHAAFVRKLARRLVRDEHAAEDVAQAALLAALEKPPPRRTNVRGWLAAVTRNLAARWGRGEARRTRREHAARRPAAPGDPGDAVARIELQQLVVAEVLALDRNDRDVIVARYFEGLDPVALARRLGVPVETARTRLRRAVDRLRARLDARHDGDRRAWSVALLPLAGLTRTSTAAGLAVAGAVAMTVKKKIALVVALLLAAGAGVVTVRHVARATPPPAKTSAAARTLPPLAAETEDRRGPEPEATTPATPAPRRDHAYKTWGNVPGATVALHLRYYGGRPDPAPIERVADEDGYAGFDPPPRDEPLYDASLRIRAEGYLTQARDVEGETTRYELSALSKFVSVRGRVVDGGGAPVEGARVGATTSDAQGCYRLLAYKPGPQRITVKHPDFLPLKRTVTAPSDGIDFVLQRGLSVSGRVVARDGTPLPGIHLRIERKDAWSDPDGRFLFSGLEPGEVLIRVHVANMAQPGASGQSWRSMTANAGDGDVEFRIVEPIVFLRVVDAAGRPFRHAKATVSVSKRGFGGRVRTLDLGVSGSLTAILRFGWAAHLTATAPTYALAEDVFGAVDKPVREITLVLRQPAATGSLEIHATDMDRRPRRFVLLSLWTRSGAPIDAYRDERVPLDERGRARVEGIVPGLYRVRVADVPMSRSVTGYGLPRTLDVEVRPREATPVEARIGDGGRIRVTVRNAAGEIAPPGSLELYGTGIHPYVLFTVEQEGPNWILASDHTKPVPLITAAPLEPGRYRVVMKRDGKKVTEGEVDVEAGRTADLVLHVDR